MTLKGVDIRAQLTDLFASADRFLPTSAMTSVYRQPCYECIYILLLLAPCAVSGWSYGYWHDHLLSHEMPWRAVMRQVGLGSI